MGVDEKALDVAHNKLMARIHTEQTWGTRQVIEDYEAAKAERPIEFPENEDIDPRKLPISLSELMGFYNSPNAVTMQRFNYFDALCRHVRWLEQQIPKREIVEAPLPEIGDYVLATKYSDGDPGDAWGVGYYDGMKYGDRHMVKDSTGAQIRLNGFRRVAKITSEYGNWLMLNAAMLEKSPPGMIDLWGMLNLSDMEGQPA
jgi:hypothetical protein